MPPIADVTIGDDVIMGHGAVSNCRKIGNNVLISMNSTILHSAEIGDYSIIAAGCIVKEKMIIPANSFVVGVPAEIKGELSKEHRWWSGNSSKIYQEWARKYKEQEL